MLDQIEKTKESGKFNIILDTYEGPIDLLLDLARRQKVDLSEISILKLSEQYIDFINNYQSIHLEIAADYLVMAAWLTYLKSRLLLPKEENIEELWKYIKIDILSEVANALWGKNSSYKIKSIQDSQITAAIQYFNQYDEFE